MDTEAFLPLRAEELSPEIGRRVWQYTELVSEVLAKAHGDGVWTKGTTSRGQGYNGATVQIRNHWLYFEFSARHWSTYAPTPFWLVYVDDSSVWAALDEALAPLRTEVPPRLLPAKDGLPPMMPLSVPCGVEKEAVVAALVEQVRAISNLLPLAERAGPDPVVAGPMSA